MVELRGLGLDGILEIVDRRHAIDPGRIGRDLGWNAGETFETGLRTTVSRHFDNEWWWRPIRETDKGERRGRIAGHAG